MRKRKPQSEASKNIYKGMNFMLFLILATAYAVGYWNDPETVIASNKAPPSIEWYALVYAAHAGWLRLSQEIIDLRWRILELEDQNDSRDED